MLGRRLWTHHLCVAVHHLQVKLVNLSMEMLDRSLDVHIVCTLMHALLPSLRPPLPLPPPAADARSRPQNPALNCWRPHLGF